MHAALTNFEFSPALISCMIHHCYIDIEKILNEEASKNEAEGWHFVKRTEFAELWKKDDPDSPIKLFKV